MPVVAVTVVKFPVVGVVAPTVPLMLIDAVPVRFVTVPLLGVPNAPSNVTKAPAVAEVAPAVVVVAPPVAEVAPPVSEVAPPVAEVAPPVVVVEKKLNAYYGTYNEQNTAVSWADDDY